MTTRGRTGGSLEPRPRTPRPPRRTLRSDLAALGRGARQGAHAGRARGAWIAIALTAAAVGCGIGYLARSASGLQLDTEGPAQGAHVRPSNVSGLVVRVRAVHHTNTLKDARLTLNDRPVLSQTAISGGVLTWRPKALAQGNYTLALTVDQPGVPWPARRTWHFVVDKTPPRIEVDGATDVAALQPVRITGRLDEPGTLTADGRAVKLGADNSFSLSYPTPPTAPIQLRAVDQAGNVSTTPLAVSVTPRHPPEPIRAVHVTALAWKNNDLRNGVLAMADRGEINAVELDLKDESGVVGYDSRVPLARRIGAVQQSYVLADALRSLHKRHLWVIGRIVCFRDPIEASAAWKAGHRSEVVQTPDGQPYSGYGGFTNFANPVVRGYNIAIAKEAAAAGIDDILYDYARRPDGPISSMVFPGIKGTPEDNIVNFMEQTRAALLPYKTYLGASLFGVSVQDPTEVAQDVRRIARAVDYVAPLIYPSHWGPGEFGVADPNRDPYAIVNRSLKAFEKKAQGTGARVVPWLQDFSLDGVTYGPAQIKAEIRGAHDAGVNEWIMWDPNVTYTPGALTPG